MSIARATIALARERNLTFVAAAIAYYAFVSLLPLSLLVVAVATTLGGPALADRVIAILGDQLSASGQQVVIDALTATSGRWAASLVGVLALAWSSLRLFRGLDRAFDELYAVDRQPTLRERLRDVLVAIGGITFAAVLVVGVGVGLTARPSGGPLANALGTALLIGALAVAFLPLYYVLPPVTVSIREVLPGAVVAAVGWASLQVGFRIYAQHAGQFAAYGVLGSVLLFVTWLYAASVIVLLGAAVNVVRRERDGEMRAASI